VMMVAGSSVGSGLPYGTPPVWGPTRMGPRPPMICQEGDSFVRCCGEHLLASLSCTRIRILPPLTSTYTSSSCLLPLASYFGAWPSAELHAYTLTGLEE